MGVPYESTGRIRQKERTRAALVAAAQALIDEGGSPTVEQVADGASISRTTAYRYFPNQRALLMATIPTIDRVAVLPPDAPADDVRARVALVIAEQLAIVERWAPQLRAALLVSLQDGPCGVDGPALRQGRVIGWLLEALEPLALTRPELDRRRLAISIRAVCGIESLVWLLDVAGLAHAEAAAIMAENAAAVLAAALQPAVQTDRK